MLTVIAAFVAGGLLVWALMAVRVARIAGERDVARARAKQIEETRADVKNLFVAEAHQAFRTVSESLVQMNKQQVDGSLETKKVEIGAMLQPLHEMLATYQGELAKSERLRSESYGGLEQQLKSLMTAHETVQRETSRLANALQSPTTRGNWGEITLKRCVELAGMTEYCDFTVQETFANDEGRRLRPDMVIRMPNKRVIVVDSKAQDVIFTEEAQRPALLRRHVEALSRKEYQSAIGETLDFVVMFVPGEQFLPRDGELFEFAVQRKIFIASPLIFIPLLRAVEAGWKAERTEENAKKMHDAGVELFNRFVRVMELISEVGGRLTRTVEKYNEAIRSIDARLWPKGEEMQRMAGSGKDLASLDQIEAVPLQSSKLRLTMQSEEEGTVVPIERP